MLTLPDGSVREGHGNGSLVVRGQAFLPVLVVIVGPRPHVVIYKIIRDLYDKKTLGYKTNIAVVENENHMT